jgi:hypothetical protein
MKTDREGKEDGVITALLISFPTQAFELRLGRCDPKWFAALAMRALGTDGNRKSLESKFSSCIENENENEGC